jgi:hypothetical protein
MVTTITTTRNCPQPILLIIRANPLITGNFDILAGGVLQHAPSLNSNTVEEKIDVRNYKPRKLLNPTVTIERKRKYIV